MKESFGEAIPKLGQSQPLLPLPPLGRLCLPLRLGLEVAHEAMPISITAIRRKEMSFLKWHKDTK